MIDKNRLVNTLCDLIKIDSPSGNESVIGQHLINQLENLGVTADFDDYGNVIGKSDTGVGNPLLLSAHMDTVEPGIGITPKIDGPLLVSDNTTVLGVTQLTSSSPTHVGFEINIRGKAAHAGVEPEKGISAVRIASELITILPQGRLDEETTFNIGVVTGGSVTNAVPENASIKGEFRSHNPVTLNGIQDILQNAITDVGNTYPEAVIDINQNTHFERYNLTGEESSVKTVTKAFESLGLEYSLKPSGGGTDANILIAHGIDSAIVGMADHNAHTVREYVVIDELLDVARVCDQILRA